MKFKKAYPLFLSFCILLILTTTSFADIAPVSYSGRSITPLQSSEVRMERGEVNIYIGERDSINKRRYRCKVRASFRMLNTTGETIIEDVGFPFLSIPREREGVYDFRVLANGKKITDIRRTKSILKSRNYSPREYEWFFWKNEFPAGLTEIEVEYGILSAPGYKARHHIVRYVMYTGSMWKSSIGVMIVKIHCPEEIRREFVIPSTGPAGYTISGKVVTWKFTDFEPIIEDNVRFKFIPFEETERFLKDLKLLRWRAQNGEMKHEARLRLAKSILSIFDCRELRYRTPDRFNANEFNKEILGRVKKEDEKDLLRKVYAIVPGGEDYILLKDMNYREERKLQRILYSIGFMPAGYRAVAGYFREAGENLEAVLKENRKDAECWRVYLMNLDRIRYGFYGVRYGVFVKGIPAGQKSIIRTAYMYCPDDFCIAKWNDIVEERIPTRIQCIIIKSSKREREKDLLIRNPGKSAFLWARSAVLDDIILKFYDMQPMERPVDISDDGKTRYERYRLDLKSTEDQPGDKSELRELMRSGNFIIRYHGSIIRKYYEEKLGQ